MPTDSTDADGFRRLEAAFHHLEGLGPSARAEWIAAHAGGDSELDASFRRRLEQMLATSGSEGSTEAIVGGGEGLVGLATLAGAEALAPRPAGELVGCSLGAYRLLAFRGEGGFGEVYLADQREPIRRRVAVKVLRERRDVDASVERFRAEVASLARLEHPGIARIYDAGSARPLRDDGTPDPRVPRPLPFMAMEFVDGVPITTDAERRSIGFAERLRLVAEVAEAIQHAHQRGLIHRDIKPSNVLVVGGEPRSMPKVIDFGIAKWRDDSEATRAAAADESDAERPVRSMTGIVGTPQYMSPEQSDRERSRDVDTRTDIYSLGLILAELLGAKIPGQPAAAPFSIRFSVPATTRDDLARVLATALDPDRERRYPTAASFAEDLRRILAGEAPLVGARSLRASARRFLHRHRWSSAMGALAMLAVLVASVVATLGLLSARAEAARADAVNAFLRDVLTSVYPERRGADVSLASVMDEAGSAAGARFAGQPLAEAETRTVIASAYASLWRVEPAVREYRAAIALFRDAAGPDAPETLRAEIRLAQALLALGKPRDADAASASLPDRIRLAFGPRSREAAQVEILRGRIAASLGRAEEGLAQIEAAAVWIDSEFPDDIDLRSSLLTERLRVTRRVAFAAGLDSPVAAEAFEAAYELSRELCRFVAERGVPDSVASFVADVEFARAAIDVGRFVESLASTDALLARVRGRLSECHDTRVDALANRAVALRAMGDARGALESMREAVACTRTITSRPSLAVLSQEFDLLPYLEYAGEHDELLAHADQVIEWAGTLGPIGASMRPAAEVYRARALSKVGRVKEAIELFGMLVADPNLRPSGRETARLRAFEAAHHASLGLVAEARAAIAASLEALPPEVLGTWQVHPDDRVTVLIEAYELLGASDEATACRTAREALLERNRTGR